MRSSGFFALLAGAAVGFGVAVFLGNCILR
jgi:hypothetical protein